MLSVGCHVGRIGGLESSEDHASLLAESAEAKAGLADRLAPPPCLPRQFDFTFVEVYRVKKFQFTSKHVDDEDSNLKENGKQGFGQICTDNPTCSCSSSRSSWNCDGEILHSPAIEVR